MVGASRVVENAPLAPRVTGPPTGVPPSCSAGQTGEISKWQSEASVGAQLCLLHASLNPARGSHQKGSAHVIHIEYEQDPGRQALTLSDTTRSPGKIAEEVERSGLTESWTVPLPGVPSARNTVPFTATVAPAFAGLGDTVWVMVARAGPTVSVVGADVLPVRGLPGAGLYVVVTAYVPGAPGAGKTPVKVGPFTGKVY